MTTTDRPRVTIAVDLDGVLADFRDGWKGIEQIGDPIPGARKFLRELHAMGDVLIWTTRCNPELGRGMAAPLLLRNIVREWLERHELMEFVADIWTGAAKPIAAAFVDDRAVHCAPQSPMWDGPDAPYSLAIGKVASLLDGLHGPTPPGCSLHHATPELPAEEVVPDA